MSPLDTPAPGYWTSRLYDILRPASRPLTYASNSPSRFRHLPGEIWRHALCTSVFRDLAGELNRSYEDLIGKYEIFSAPGLSWPITWRRYTRIDHFGLSGLLFYEIRAPESEIHYNSYESLDDTRALTVEGIFGDPDDPTDGGMSVDDLLDAIHAKVVFFPAYACTSFIAGQAMHSFLLNTPQIRPHPARAGFSVVNQTDYGPVKPTLSAFPKPFGDITNMPEKKKGDNVINEMTGRSCRSFDANEAYPSNNDTSFSFSVPPEDHYTPLRIRCSSLSEKDVRAFMNTSGRRFSDYDELESNGNTTDSTFDSGSIGTPPASVTLPFGVLDAKISPGVPSNDGVCLSMDHSGSPCAEDLLSLLDFSSPVL